MNDDIFAYESADSLSTSAHPLGSFGEAQVEDEPPPPYESVVMGDAMVSQVELHNTLKCFK